jgi:hypothetical protein
MRVNELISERASDDIVSSIAGGWKKGRDLNFTDKPTDNTAPKKQLSNQAGTADIRVNRYQLTDLKYAMEAVLKGNVNSLSSQQIESVRELLKQLNSA